MQRLTIFFLTLVILLLAYLTYSNYYTNEGLIGYPGAPPPFYWGTRQWAPTHLMSYDVRGDVPVGYYPVGIFNQPEYPSRRRYFYTNYNSPGFYTPEYVNPWQGIVPSIYNSTFSVPYKVDENNNSDGVKPILDKSR